MKRYGRPIFRVIKNTKSVRGAEQMIRYVAFRSRDITDQTRGCFDRNLDHADVKAFMRELPDRLTRHSAAPKAFHCVLSLRREDYESAGLPDWRSMVREVMETFERESKRSLHWMAAHHDNPTHPHCHIIIKAVCQRPGGAASKLWLSKEDLRHFREVAGRVFDRLADRTRDLDRAAGPDHRPERGPGLAPVGSILGWIQQQVRASQERERLREESLRSRLGREEGGRA